MESGFRSLFPKHAGLRCPQHKSVLTSLYAPYGKSPAMSQPRRMEQTETQSTGPSVLYSVGAVPSMLTREDADEGESTPCPAAADLADSLGTVTALPCSAASKDASADSKKRGNSPGSVPSPTKLHKSGSRKESSSRLGSEQGSSSKIRSLPKPTFLEDSPLAVVPVQASTADFQQSAPESALRIRVHPSQPRMDRTSPPQSCVDLGQRLQQLKSRRDAVRIPGSKSESWKVGVEEASKEMDPDVLETERALKEHARELRTRQRRSRRASVDGAAREAAAGNESARGRRRRQPRGELQSLLSWDSQDSELLKEIGAAVAAAQAMQKSEAGV